MISGLQKLRYFLAARPELVARVCIAVALVSAIGAGFTFVNPPTAEVTDTTDRQTIATSLNSQVTVEQNSSLYPQGEVLTNMPVYSHSTTPNATISAVTTPPRDEGMQINQRVMLVYEARTGSDETFWQQTRLLRETNTSSDGGEVASNATINIPAIERRIAQLESEIGDGGHVIVRLEVETQYSTAHHQGTFKDRGAIDIRDDSYEIDHLSMRDEYGTTESVTRPVPSKTSRVSLPLIGDLAVPHTTLVLALLGFAGVIGSGVTVAFGRRFDLEAERAALHKARYAQWISSGTLPSHPGERTVYMNTLEDLVDVAIDSGKRIVHDRSQGSYALIDEHTVYVYPEDTVGPDGGMGRTSDSTTGLVDDAINDSDKWVPATGKRDTDRSEEPDGATNEFERRTADDGEQTDLAADETNET